MLTFCCRNWSRLGLATLALLGATACRPEAEQTALPPAARWACPGPSGATPATDSFALETTPPDRLLPERYRVPFAQETTALAHTFPVGCCVADSGYVSSHYYSTVPTLSRRGICHAVVYSEMDDFFGLFLVLPDPRGRPQSVYVAGVNGSANTADGMYDGWSATTGQLRGDSLQVRTRTEHWAFRGSGRHSYADQVTNRYRIEATAGRASLRLTRHDSIRQRLDGYFN